MSETNPHPTEAKPGQVAAAASAGEPYLVVDDLTVKFPTADGLVHAVSNLSYSVELGKTLGIVGESGSGKPVSSLAVLGLHDERSAQISGSIRDDVLAVD
ncbi:MAG: ABC transporter ATP-binding protein, partial [Nocardioides sp.]|nr:ABC transporter ATP-binding protein [Nocardioides sp.]